MACDLDGFCIAESKNGHFIQAPAFIIFGAPEEILTSAMDTTADENSSN